MQRGSVVDSSYTHTGDETYNVLEVEATRDDLTHPFFCKATNNDRIGPDTVHHERNVTCKSSPVVKVVRSFVWITFVWLFVFSV